MNDIEEIENKIEDELFVRQVAGYNDLTSFERFKNDAIHGLVKHGDSFAVTLGLALAEAKLKDAVKIIRYWHQLCEQHALIYRAMKAQEQAESKLC